MNLEAAAAYAGKHGLQALIVSVSGKTVFERYGAGFDRSTPHALYSGTKSFWGVTAVAAQDDGLLDLDELVARTIPEWAADARKSHVTLRHLLQLTSGIGFGGLGSAVPAYAKALATPLVAEPGRVFAYGGIPLQVFGAVLQRKLHRRAPSPHAYLQERILDPLALKVAGWRKLPDGTQPLPTGAMLAAGEWLKFGRMLASSGSYREKQIVRRTSLERCYDGSTANPRYGLCFWLSPLAEVPDLVYASGSGGQALYVAPSQELAVVKFGDSKSYKHDAFLRALFEVARKPQRRNPPFQASR
ncbi:MAG: serine hydrolase [Candidatus Eremiobacteraeota bacterium]|nr:serine hydrolase [Candidatus Eremiobacteraeota bacterium]